MTLTINTEDWGMKILYGLIVLVLLMILGIAAVSQPIWLLIAIVLIAGVLVHRFRG